MKVSKKKLQLAMAKKCINACELAELTGVSNSLISSYLAGSREPRTKTLGKIAKALSVDVTEIIE